MQSAAADVSVCYHLKLTFYHHVGAKRGRLRVLVEHHILAQHAEVWRNSTQALQGVWWRTVIWIPSNHTFQVGDISLSLFGWKPLVWWISANPDSTILLNSVR